MNTPSPDISITNTTATLIILENDMKWAQRIKNALEKHFNFSKIVIVKTITELESLLTTINDIFALTIDIRLGSEDYPNTDGSLWIMEKLSQYKDHFGFRDGLVPFYIVSGELSDFSVETFRNATNLSREQIIRKMHWSESKDFLCQHLAQSIDYYESISYSIPNHTSLNTHTGSSSQSSVKGEDPTICRIRAYFDGTELISGDQAHPVQHNTNYVVDLEIRFEEGYSEIVQEDALLISYVYCKGIISNPNRIEIPIKSFKHQKKQRFTFTVSFQPDVQEQTTYVYLPIYYGGRELHVFSFSVVTT